MLAGSVCYGQSTDYGSKLRGNIYIVKGTDTTWIQHDGTYSDFYSTGLFRFNSRIVAPGVTLSDSLIGVSGRLSSYMYTPTAASSDSTTKLATTAFVKQQVTSGTSGVIPSQAGNANKYITTDGSNLSWTSNIYTGAGDKELLFSMAGAVSGEPSLVWNYGTSRMGVLTPSPAYGLDVNTDARIANRLHANREIQLSNYTVSGSPGGGYGWLYSYGDSLRYKNSVGTVFTLGSATGTDNANKSLSNLTTTNINLNLLAASTSLHIGSSSKQWGGVYLSNGGFVNFSNGGVVLTHSASKLTVAGGSLAVPDDPYSVTWNGSNEVPTKNAVFDKIQTIVSGGGGDSILATNNTWLGTNTFVGIKPANIELTHAGSGIITRAVPPAGANAGNLIVMAPTTTQSGYAGGSVYLVAGSGPSGNGNIYMYGGTSLGPGFGDVYLGFDGVDYIGTAFAKTQGISDSSGAVATTAYVDRVAWTSGGGGGSGDSILSANNIWSGTNRFNDSVFFAANRLRPTNIILTHSGSGIITRETPPAGAHAQNVILSGSTTLEAGKNGSSVYIMGGSGPGANGNVYLVGGTNLGPGYGDIYLGTDLIGDWLGDVYAKTQPALTADSSIATTKFVSDAISGISGGANTALSNLSSVSINASLTPASESLYLGATDVNKRWGGLYIKNAGYIDFFSGDVLLTHATNKLIVSGGSLEVPDEAYSSGWNSSNGVPTKNAIYDKIESMAGGGSSVPLWPGVSINIETANQFGVEFKPPLNQYTAMSAGNDSPHASLVISGYYYVLTRQNPARLHKYDVNDVTSVSTLIFPSDGIRRGPEQMIYIPSKDKIYIAFTYSSKMAVVQVGLGALTDTSTVINRTSTGLNLGSPMFSDGSHLYVAGASTTHADTLFKFSLTDWSLTNKTKITGNSGAYPHAIAYDGTRIFVTTTSNVPTPAHQKIYTFTASSMAIGADSTVMYKTMSDDMVTVGDYLFIAKENSDGQIYVIDKSVSPMVKDSIQTPFVTDCYGVFYDGGHIWATMAGSPGGLVKIDPYTMQMAYTTFPSGYDSANELVTDGTRLFVTFYTNPFRVARLGLPKMTPFTDAKITIDTGTSRSLVVADNNRIIRFTSSSAITVTVPTGLPQGFSCMIMQSGTGQVTFSASGTTVSNRQSFTKTAGQHAVASIVHIGGNVFITSGDME